VKKSRFSEDQILGILKQAEAGRKKEELCREHGISPATFYIWGSRFGGLELSDTKQLKVLEEENSRLIILVADLTLDNRIRQHPDFIKLTTPLLMWSLNQVST
jgi:putative transposase